MNDTQHKGFLERLCIPDFYRHECVFWYSKNSKVNKSTIRKLYNQCHSNSFVELIHNFIGKQLHIIMIWYVNKGLNNSQGPLLILIRALKLNWAMTWRNITMSMQYIWLQSSSSNVIFFWKLYLYGSHGFLVCVCNSHKQTFARWYSSLLVIGRVYIYFYHQQGVDKRISR